MFTGIIEEKGTITSLNKLQNGAIITVGCKKVLDDLKIDDSIAINGVCQTVVKLLESGFQVFASYETLNITTFGSLECGDTVNLERALKLSDRLGGHIVCGHVDGVGKLIAREKIGDAYKMTFELPDELIKEVVKKGSIAIDGVSLTIAEVLDNKITIAVIPHTFKNTLLEDLPLNSAVNIETDILGKYVARFIGQNAQKSKITADFLERNGFI